MEGELNWSNLTNKFLSTPDYISVSKIKIVKSQRLKLEASTIVTAAATTTTTTTTVTTTTTMKSLLVIVLLCGVALAWPDEEKFEAPAPRENCDCQCDAYTWNYRGKVIGNCKR